MRNFFLLTVMGAALGCAPCFGQSEAGEASQQTKQSADQSAQAVGTGLKATGASAAAGLRLTSEAAAVPLWLAGSTVVVGSEVAGASGEVVWDASKDDSAARPRVNPDAGLPPPPPVKPAAPDADESPAEAMKKTEGKHK